MSTSVNGWVGIQDETDSRLSWIQVPGTKKKVLVRKEAAPLFAAILSEINKLLIPLDGGPLDGWEYRDTRTGQGLSAHASGTAVDFRYDVLLADNEIHWSDSKHAIMHKLLDKYTTSSGKRVFGWGGDWTPGKYADEMHLELIQSWSPGAQGENCTMADVLDCIKRLRIKPDGTFSVINVVVPPKPAPTPTPTPVPVLKPPTSGPDWLRSFILSHGVPEAQARILWSLGMRESGGERDCVYPAGSPKDGNWNRDTAPYWDSGWAQINNRHLQEIKNTFGQSADMKLMLDPEACFKYVKKLSKNFTYWNDWGLSADGKTFDWSGYPSDWVAQYAKDSEDGYLRYYNAWKPVSGSVTPTPTPTPTPKPKPLPKPVKPSVSLSKIIKAAKTDPKLAQGGSTYPADVKIVEAALAKEGLLASQWVDGSFGTKTIAAYKSWQLSLGYSGSDADGIPGQISLTKLGEKYGFSVVS